MRLNAPTKIVFNISVILVAVGVLDYLGILNFGYEYFLVLAGYVLLALGTMVKGM